MDFEKAMGGAWVESSKKQDKCRLSGWKNLVALRNRSCYTFHRKEKAMNTLHVRSVPDDLYLRLQKLALAQSRSLSAQVITLLEQAVEIEERRRQRARALASIQRRRFKAPTKAPSTLELLREDRAR
jgi:plasmid stability protein